MQNKPNKLGPNWEVLIVFKPIYIFDLFDLISFIPCLFHEFNIGEPIGQSRSLCMPICSSNQASLQLHNRVISCQGFEKTLLSLHLTLCETDVPTPERLEQQWRPQQAIGIQMVQRPRAT